VRTIRYYDKIGLLKPSSMSPSGQRFYSELDFVRLQQILTLKWIGLSLNEIKSLLTTDTTGIQRLLARQRRVLEEKSRRLAHVIQTIETAQQAFYQSRNLALDDLINIMKAVNMNTQPDWFNQFFTDDQQQMFTEIENNRTLEDHKQTGAAWKALFADIRHHIHQDPADQEAQRLVERWDALIAQSTQDDGDFAARMNQAYAHLADALPEPNAPQALHEWTQAIQDSAAFIEKARALRR
jgi:DNA-binding transcriptional MerR regulator